MIHPKIITLWIVLAICGYAYAQDTLTIRQIQQVPVGRDSSLYAGDTVVTGGVVTAGTGIYDNDRFYVEDPSGGLFSGIYVIFRFDLGSYPSVSAGDSVLINGIIHESVDLNHLTTISPSRTAVHIRSHNMQLPAPETILASIVDTSHVIDTLLEHYESVFTQINNVTIDSLLNNYWICHDSTDSFYLRVDSDLLPVSFRPIKGTLFQSIQGFVYSLGTKNYLRPKDIYSFSLPNNAPIIIASPIIPPHPTGYDTISGEADFYDNGAIAQARLIYRLNQGQWITIPMTFQSANHYAAEFGPFPRTSQIDYYFEALDNEGYFGREPMNAPDSSYAITITRDDRCHYVPGDLNGNGIANGVDVVCAVAYLKGRPYPPPYPCDCLPGLFFPAGDVSGSCAFNGLDITFLITYYRGGPGHLGFCPDCPPRWP
jgi:hypothetical protein